MGLQDFLKINESVKFSPTLTPKVLGKAVKGKKTNPKLISFQKGGPLTVLSKNNAVSDYIQHLRSEVEKTFGSSAFDPLYSDYVSLLKSLFFFAIGFMLSSTNNLEDSREQIIDYIEGPLYRRLPYSVKNIIVLASNNPPKAEDISKNLAAVQKKHHFIFNTFGELLLSSSKIVTIESEKKISTILEPFKNAVQDVSQ